MTDETGGDRRNMPDANLHNELHVSEARETTPLVNTAPRRNFHEKIWLICLVLILIVGVSIGAYLLSVEGESDAPEKISLVFLEEWTAQPAISNITKLMLPSQKVLLMQTNSSSCWNEIECIKVLQNIQKYQIEQLDEPDISYNFIVAGDGRVYEGRGWNYQSSYTDSDNEVLVVALLGTYDEVAPTNQQTQELQAFLDYAVMRDNLVPCYNMVVRSSSSSYLLNVAFDIEDNVRRQSKWC